MPPLTPFTQDQFIAEMIAHKQVHNIKMTSPAMLGSYNQYVVPDLKHMAVKASELVHLELQQPRQTQLDIDASTITKIQLGEAAWIDSLHIVNHSKVNMLTIIPSIGGRVTEVIVDNSQVTEVYLFGDPAFSSLNYLNSLKAHSTVSTKIGLKTLNIADDVVVISGHVSLVEFINIQVDKRLILDGVKTCRLINGKYHEIHITGPMATFEMISDNTQPFWRQMAGPPAVGTLSHVLIEQLTITSNPPAPLPLIDTTGGNLKITGILAGTKITVKNSNVEYV